MPSVPDPAPRASSPDEVDRLLAGVEGWLGPEEGRLLYRLAGEADPARLGARAAVARRIGIARRSLYGIRLRAYDSDTLGYARFRNALSRG